MQSFLMNINELLMAYSVNLGKYGFNLCSRIQGRKVFEEIAKSMEAEGGSEKIVIDFSGVRFMSLSFATELLVNLKFSNLFVAILIKESSPMIKYQLRFVIREMNEKNKIGRAHV